MSRPRLLALAAILALVAALSARAPNAEPDEKESPDVVVVVESIEDALKMLPKSYLLSPARYRAIEEQLARLAALERPVAQTPTRLSLKGKIDGEHVLLTATYEFKIDKPGTLVRLGGSPAMAMTASLDGKTPLLIANKSGVKGRDEDGFSVQIDRASDESKPPQLTLDLIQPLLLRDGSQGFTLSLPRAPITKIEFDLPPGSRDVRVNGKAVASSSLKGNQLTLFAGLSDKLDVDWKPAQAAAAAAVLTADGVVQVRLEKNRTVTTAVLKLRVSSGQTKTWKLLVPVGAELSVAEKERVEKIEDVDNKGKRSPLRTIHLKQASAEPLTVSVTSTTPGAKPGGASVSVGPFNVVGAAPQKGGVLVSSAVAEWHVEAAATVELAQRPASEEELRADPTLAAAFRYVPGGERQTGLPWLKLDVESVSGQLKSKPAYKLVLMPAEKEGEAPHWQLQATLTVTARRAGIDRFRVQLPAGCEIDDQRLSLPDKGVKWANVDKNARIVEFRLDHSNVEAVAPVTVRFEANYPPAATKQATLALPRMLDTFEHEGTVVVSVPPAAGVELLAPEKTPGLKLTRQSTYELAYDYSRRAPAAVEATWRPYRPVTRVDALIDVTLSAGRAQVRQELRHQLPAGAPPRLRLDVPDAVAAVRVSGGGKLASLAGGVAAVDLTGGVVVLDYEFATPEEGKPLLIPLAQPDECSGETRVRVWSDAGSLPAAPRHRDWTEQNLEAVAGRARLPVLVLRAGTLKKELTLLVAPEEAASRPLIERCLVRVEVDERGVQSYVVRYRLGHLSGRQMDFEMPAAAKVVGLSCKLDGRRVDYDLLNAEPGKAGRLVRLRLDPKLIKRPSVLELSYHLEPHYAGQMPLTTTLTPPRPLADEASFPTRWGVVAPEAWVIVRPEPGPGSPVNWSLRRWLYVPRASAGSAELEAWFTGAESSADAGPEPTSAAWGEGDEALRVTHVPRQAWLVGCSLAAVAAGLVLTRLFLSGRPKRTALAWVLGGLLLLGTLCLAVLMPALAAQVTYGCQPGMLVLAVLVVVQWLLHERSRRKTVFLPSFSRPRQGSSMSRKENARPHGEPSTVDAPRLGSSLERGT